MAETDLPKSWSVVKLDSVASVQTGLAKGKQGLKDPITLPYLRVANVQDGYLDLADIKEIQVERSEVERYRLQEGDVLLTEGGDNDKLGRGDVWRGQIPVCLHQNHIFVVRTQRDVLEPYFLSALAGSSYGKLYFRRCSKQSTNLATINSTQLKEFPVILPPKHEQLAIVRCLRTWNEAVALTEQRLAAGERRKQGLMQRLLTGQVRLPEYATSQTSRPTDYGWIPSDWRIVTLGELVTQISRPEVVMPDKTYRLIGVRWYVAGAHIHETVSGANLKISSLSRVEINDIIYNKMWTTKAAFAVARGEHAGACGTGEYPQFRAREDLLDVNFLGYLYHLPRFQHAATSLCRGTTGRARLNPSDFLKLEVPLPSLQEQRHIVNLLDACDHELDLLARKRDALQRLKRGLMQQLLTGRVRVKV